MSNRAPFDSLLLSFIICMFSLASGLAEAAEGESEPRIPVATDFSADGATAKAQSAPILLLVSQHYCSFCKQIKRDILHPMIKAGDYQGQLLMRELFIDQQPKVIDFHGKPQRSASISRSYGVNLTPTLLFLGPEGEELSRRIVGYYTPEMFFYYVDEAIKEAIEKLSHPQPE